MSSPTQRSLAYLRKLGYTAQVVEKFNPFSHTRLDLFGCIDIVAIKHDEKGVVGVQATSMGNVKARIHKILLVPEMSIWLSAGNRLAVHGFGKLGARGKRKTWQIKVVPITLEMLQVAPPLEQKPLQ